MFTKHTKENKCSDQEKRLTLLLRQVGEKAGLSPEEMRRRYDDFLSQVAKPSLSNEELDKRTKEFVTFVLKGKRKPTEKPLKVTVSMNQEEAVKFQRLKARFAVKSNASVFRRLLSETKTED
jgi:hypothetical protein